MNNFALISFRIVLSVALPHILHFVLHIDLIIFASLLWCDVLKMVVWIMQIVCLLDCSVI